MVGTIVDGAAERQARNGRECANRPTVSQSRRRVPEEGRAAQGWLAAPPIGHTNAAAPKAPATGPPGGKGACWAKEHAVA